MLYSSAREVYTSHATFFFVLSFRGKFHDNKKDGKEWNPLMNCNFYTKKPISYDFPVYLTSANESKASVMVTMVAHKAMTQFYVW